MPLQENQDQAVGSAVDRARRSDLLRLEDNLTVVRGTAIVVMLIALALGEDAVGRNRGAELASVVALVAVLLVGRVALGSRRHPTLDATDVDHWSTALWLGDAVASVAVAMALAGIEGTSWLILVVIPVEGALRLGIRGGLIGWCLAVVGYVIAQAGVDAMGADAYEARVLVVRLGLLLALALAAGQFGQHHHQYRDAAAAALARLQVTERWRSDMVSALGHDVRGPLSAISSLAQLVRQRRSQLTDTQQTDLLRGMEKQAARALALANDLLELAQLDAGNLRLRRQVVNLEKLVREAAGPLAEGLVLDVPAGLHLSADPGRLGQVLTNLIGNAERHGRPPVIVTAARRSGVVSIEVADGGDGVPAEQRERLFKRFAAGDTLGSTGLGLWIARELVAAHGGDLRYEDGQPSGARFIVEIPDAPGLPTSTDGEAPAARAAGASVSVAG